MTARHEIWLTNDRGVRLVLLDNVEQFNWNRVVNGIGRCSVVLPDGFDRGLIGIDYRIEIWRAAEEGLPLALENSFMIRRPHTETNTATTTKIDLNGVGGNDLLKRRVVAWVAGSAEARKTDFIDDMMKDIVRENLGALAGNDPDGNSRSFDAAFFSVDPDTGLGPSITKSFSWRNVLDVLQDLSEAAREAGDQVYFAVEPANVTDYIFKTYINQLGQDRRFPGGFNPITFSVEDGNIEFPSLDEDYDEELNYVYGAGQGEGAGRNIQTAFDLAAMNRSIWGRREGFRDSRQEDTDAGVTAEAQAKLSEGRPKRRFSAELTSIAGSRYGLDWGFGDRVTVTYADRQFDAMIWSVSISVDEDGLETVIGRVEVEDVA